MVEINIDNEEIQALDAVLNKVEVKPIIGYKLATLRLKIAAAMQQEQKKAVKKKAREIIKEDKPGKRNVKKS